MNVSITQAHKMTGVARSTIYKDMDEGKLSFNENGRGKREIMVSELQRVYGEIDASALDKKTSTPKHSPLSENVAHVVSRPETHQATGQSTGQGDQIAVLQERILSLKNTVDEKDNFIQDLKSERQKSRELYEEQLEGLKNSLDKAQDGYNQITRLLEDKTSDKSGEWQKNINALENRLTNQEKSEKQRQEREQKILNENKRIKQAYNKQRQALEAEKNKSFFKKIFG